MPTLGGGKIRSLRATARGLQRTALTNLILLNVPGFPAGRIQFRWAGIAHSNLDRGDPMHLAASPLLTDLYQLNMKRDRAGCGG
jgi:hypothetical protein